MSQPAFVKGCQMPTLHRMPELQRQTVEGRRRTSLEGGNRGLRSDMFGWRAVYGDLNYGSAFTLLLWLTSPSVE